MKTKDLRVRIRRIFKGNLDARFNPENAVKVEDEDKFKINVECLLCCRYSKLTCTSNTSKCPFKRFELANEILLGCVCWIRLVTRVLYKSRKFSLGPYSISWSSFLDKEARRQLILLRRRAEKLITWV